MLTLLIMTRNRPAYLARTLSYYQSQRFRPLILIADSSDPSSWEQNQHLVQALAARLNLCHQRFPPDIHFYAKFVAALKTIETPYTVASGDDDFLIPAALDEAVQFLETHSDYSIAHGEALSFQMNENSAFGTLFQIGLFPQNSMEHPSAVDRFQRHLANYCATFDSVERTAALIENWTFGLQFEDINFGELTPSCLSLIQGKSKKLNRLFLIKQGGAPTEFGGPDSLDWLAASAWPNNYRNFHDILARALAQHGGVPLETAARQVKQAFWAYMGHRRLMQEIAWGLMEHVTPPQWTREHWNENDPALALPALLNPAHPYHADFLPAYKHIVGDGLPPGKTNASSTAIMDDPALLPYLHPNPLPETGPAASLLKRANPHLRASQWAVALKLLEQALPLDPHRPDLLASVGQCLIQLNRAADGLPYLQQAVQAQPTSPALLLTLAGALTLCQRPTKTIEAIYKQVIAHDPHHPLARRKLGEIYLAQGRATEGIECLSQLAQDHPDDTVTLVTLAHAAWLSGDLEAMSLWLKEILRCDPANAFVWRELSSPWATDAGRAAHRLRRAGRWAEALHQLEQLVKLNPRWAEGYLEMGDALSALGRADDARAHWQRAKQLQPELADLKQKKAELCQERHHFEEAFIAWQHVLALRPGEVDMFARIQDPFFHYGQLDFANRLLQRIVDDHQRLVQASPLKDLKARFLRLYTNQIGHMGHLDWYVKMDLLGQRSPHPPMLAAAHTPNPSYLNCWRRYFSNVITDPAEVAKMIPTGRFIEDGLVAIMDAEGKQTADYSYGRQVAIQKQWEAEGRPPLLSLSPAEIERGWACLRQDFGVPREAWFVSLHVRDDRASESSQGTRNGRIDSYFAAIRAITARGGWVIRMGDAGMTLLPPMPNVIDYAHSAAKSDWMDVFLWSQCRFFVGTNSGPIFVPPTFGVPVVATNWSPLGIPDLFINGLCIFKQYWSEARQRYLTYPEVLASSLGFTNVPNLVSNLGVQHQDNSPEEIEAVVQEMLERLEGRLQYTEAEEALQARFNQLPGKAPGVGRIGRAFLRAYAPLLDEPPDLNRVAQLSASPAPAAPRLSVIIPNYNHAHYLAGTLEAILTQSRPADEVIVVDDASTDNSLAVLRDLQQRYPTLRVAQNERNQGVVYSINRAVELATGDYVFCQAADDEVRPGFFEKSMALLAQHPEAGLCCAKSTRHNLTTGQTTENCPHLSDTPRYFSPEEIAQFIRTAGRYPIEGNTVILKRSAYYEAGGYIPELKWHGDWFYLLAIAFTHGMCYLPEVLAVNRIQSESYSGRGVRDWAQQREVISHMLHLLALPTFAAAKPWFAHSNVLAFFISPAMMDDDVSLHLQANFPYDVFTLMDTANVFLQQAATHAPGANSGNSKFAQLLLNQALAQSSAPPPNLNYLRAVALCLLQRPVAAHAAAQAELALQPNHALTLNLLPQIAALPKRPEPTPQPITVAKPATLFQRAIAPSAPVDIVIPIYGQAALLEKCVASVLKTAPEAHLILVDDCSPGAEIQRAFQQWKDHPRITLARTPENSGFIGACRLGASLGQSPFILFLNSDTEALDSGWLEKMLPAEDPIAIVGALLLYPPHARGPLAGTIQHAGVARKANGVPYHPFIGLAADMPEANAARDVNAVTGGCLLIRRAVWDELGGWDARFGKGVYEDVDLCWRARQKGYRVVYQPAARFYHAESASKAPDGHHALNAHTQENLKQLREKWPHLASDEELFFGEKTARRWEKARKQLARAQTALQQKNVQTARIALRKALELADDLADVHLSYAQLLSAQGEHAPAAEQLEAALRLLPAAWVVRLQLVDAWQAAHQPQKAAAALQPLLEVFPNLPEVQQRAVQLGLTARAPEPPPIAPPPAAPQFSATTVETVQLLLNQPDLLAALQQHADKLTPEVLALVRLNANTARSDDNPGLGAALDNFAAHIQRALEQRAAQARAAVTFQRLLDADDIAVALEENRAHLDEALLELIHANALTAQAEGNTELVDGLSALAEHIGQMVLSPA